MSANDFEFASEAIINDTQGSRPWGRPIVVDEKLGHRTWRTSLGEEWKFSPPFKRQAWPTSNWVLPKESLLRLPPLTKPNMAQDPAASASFSKPNKALEAPAPQSSLFPSVFVAVPITLGIMSSPLFAESSGSTIDTWPSTFPEQTSATLGGGGGEGGSDLTSPSSFPLLPLQHHEGCTSLIHGVVSHHNWIAKQVEPATTCREIGKFYPLTPTRTLAHCKFLRSVVSSSTPTKWSPTSPKFLKKLIPQRCSGRPRILTHTSQLFLSSVRHTQQRGSTNPTGGIFL